jgi:hypothetical protein
VLDSGDAKAGSFVQQSLDHWRADRDLASARDADALATLPQAERDAWRALWAEVDVLLAKVRSDPASPEPTGSPTSAPD